MSIADPKNVTDNAYNSVIWQKLIFYVQIKIVAFWKSQKSFSKKAERYVTLTISKVWYNLIFRKIQKLFV